MIGMCESCQQIPALTTIELGQDGGPFRVCAPCFFDALSERVRRG